MEMDEIYQRIREHLGVEDDSGELPKMKKVSFIRTARVLMDGTTYVRKSVL